MPVMNISIPIIISIAPPKIVALLDSLSPTLLPISIPIKQQIKVTTAIMQDAKDTGRTIDVSCGRRTRSVIITDTEHVILSSLQTETIAKRLSGGDTDDGEEVDE